MPHINLLTSTMYQGTLKIDDTDANTENAAQMHKPVAKSANMKSLIYNNIIIGTFI